MVAYRTEEEQVDALKKWWNENGRTVIAAIVIGLVGTLGWQSWQDHNKDEREEASRKYWQFIKSLDENAPSRTGNDLFDLGSELKMSHPQSSYSKLVAMHLARIYVEDGSFSLAEQELRWVLDASSTHDHIQELARIRLARILATDGQSEQALEILSSAEADSFKSLRASVLGDINWNLGNLEAAVMAYQEAYAHNNGAFIASRLEEKLRFLNSDSIETDDFDVISEKVLDAMGTDKPSDG